MNKNPLFKEYPYFIWKIANIYSTQILKSNIFTIEDVKFRMMLQLTSSDQFAIYMEPEVEDSQSTVPSYSIKASISIMKPNKPFGELQFTQKTELINNNSKGHELRHELWNLSKQCLLDNLDEGHIKMENTTFLCVFGPLSVCQRDVNETLKESSSSPQMADDAESSSSPQMTDDAESSSSPQMADDAESSSSLQMALIPSHLAVYRLSTMQSQLAARWSMMQSQLAARWSTMQIQQAAHRWSTMQSTQAALRCSTMQSRLLALRSSTMQSNLAVYGSLTMQSNLAVYRSLTMQSNLAVYRSLTMQSNLAVYRSLTMQSYPADHI